MTEPNGVLGRVRAVQRRHAANIRFHDQDVRELASDDCYDVITCVAALHHVPFAETLRTLRAHLTPGGRLVVLGVYQEQTIGDWALSAAAIRANMVMGWAKAPRGRQLPVSMTAPTRPVSMSLSEIREQAPGARIRRHLFWRYSVVCGR